MMASISRIVFSLLLVLGSTRSRELLLICCRLEDTPRAAKSQAGSCAFFESLLIPQMSRNRLKHQVPDATIASGSMIQKSTKNYLVMIF